MTNELHVETTSGLNVYVNLLNSTGQAYNGSAFETIAGANWMDYAIAATEAAGGIYLADMPAVAAGAYSYVAYSRAGEDPAMTDTYRGTGWLAWSGTAEIVPASAAALAVVDANVDDILEDTGTTLPAAIAGVGAGSGTGYYSDTVDNGTSPLDGVRVQLYTAADRVGLAYEAYTNALGVFEMWPDPGTYYRWLDLAGYSFTQDVEVEVTEP